MSHRTAVAALRVVLAVVGFAINAAPQDSFVQIVTQTTFAPIYMRYFPGIPAEAGFMPLIYYRTPSCIRLNFNLLLFYDPPKAFGCPLIIEGIQVREPGEVPKQTVLEEQEGGAVPIWFVPLDSWYAATGDGSLSMPELESISGLLKGEATFYREVHHYNPGTSPGGANVPKFLMLADGTLEDGRSFSMELNGQNHGEGTDFRVVKIEILKGY